MLRRQKITFPGALVLAVFASAVSLATAGYAQVPRCGAGTVATYLGTTCELDAGGSSDKVTYTFNSVDSGGYTCTGTASICNGIGTNGANLAIKQDVGGPYTLRIGNTDLWNVSGTGRVDLKITGTVQGATLNENWPHFNGQPGQSGAGVEDNITTVDCSGTHGCLDSKNGVNQVVCDASETNGPNCNDNRCPLLTILSGISCYQTEGATFKDSTTPYAFTIEIKLAANGGSATLYSVGTHLLPPDSNPHPPGTTQSVPAALRAPLAPLGAGTHAWVGRTITPQRRETPGPPPYCNPCLFYGGDLNPNWTSVNGLANDNTLLVANTSTFIPFTVDSPGWSVTGLFTNDIADGYNHIDPAEATWSIATGMSDGNAGTVIASGTAGAAFTPTGRVAFGSHPEYTVLVSVDPPVNLAPGQYWLSVVPQCTVAGNSCESAQYFVSNTQGTNSYGPPEPGGRSFLNSAFFGHTYSAVCGLIAASGCNLFSGGVLGTVE
ncbi:MAG TPA: hypothetical protein VGZ29_06795 [Terriglobia bacterium]|nr:hypothetical protein [Terriglobia bacterium]